MRACCRQLSISLPAAVVLTLALAGLSPSVNAAPHFSRGTPHVGGTTYYVDPPTGTEMGENLKGTPVVVPVMITRSMPGCSEGYWRRVDGSVVFGAACRHSGAWRLAA